MKSHKIVVFAALIGVFGVSNAREKATCEHILPFLGAQGIKFLANNYAPEVIDGKKLRESAARGVTYSFYQMHQRKMKEEQFMNDLRNNDLGSLIQQVGYIAVDASVSEGVDRLSQLEQVKQLMRSEPVQYISNNISVENKNFFKDQLIVAASAGLIDIGYRFADSKYSKPELGDSQYKNGFGKVVVGNVCLASIDHFFVKKYITDSAISPLIALGIYVGFKACVSSK